MQMWEGAGADGSLLLAPYIAVSPHPSKHLGLQRFLGNKSFLSLYFLMGRASDTWQLGVGCPEERAEMLP